MKFTVWNSTKIHPQCQTLTDIIDAVQALGQSCPKFGLRWLPKAGEGGAWQSGWDEHFLAIDGPDKLKFYYDLGQQSVPRCDVVGYVTLRGVSAWRKQEHDQIVQVAKACGGHVVLNLEPGLKYWTGPVDQGSLQEEYIWPLEEKLRSAVGRKLDVEMAMIPRLWTMNALGGTGCLAAWLAFAQRASWECYDGSASDLTPPEALPRVRAWTTASSWGTTKQYRVPIVQRSRLPVWAMSSWSRAGLGVWHLDGN